MTDPNEAITNLLTRAEGLCKLHFKQLDTLLNPSQAAIAMQGHLLGYENASIY
ncbi:MAG: hypothetical protein AAF708_13830 [Deinococcota bacterium]